MKLFADICLVAVLGTGLLCFGGDNGKRVVDSSCDIQQVRLPAEWKSQCVNEAGNLRRNLPEAVRSACIKIAANNRKLKGRCK